MGKPDPEFMIVFFDAMKLMHRCIDYIEEMYELLGIDGDVPMGEGHKAALAEIARLRQLKGA
jgi:hypothetical protein